MGSLEEEKLIQMVQDFMESESPSHDNYKISTSSSSEPTSFLNQSVAYLTLQEILGSVTDAEMVVLELVLKCSRNVKFERNAECLKKWLVMQLRTNGYDASLCKTKSTSRITTVSFQGGDYEYIDIMVKDDEIKGASGNGSTRLIVDIDFKSQFELARPTSKYKHLLRPLPSIFVGTEEKLLKIVSLLCSAARQSLEENGLHVPPWRKASYMQSKWLSHCQKEQISSATRNVKSSKEVGGSKWSPPRIKINTERKDWKSGSALTSQFSSNMSINCC